MTPNSSETAGTLFIVATPLGNLEDMTFRAVSTLKQVSLIAAEDTRHSKKLLAHYSISTPVISCHEHNENKQTPILIEKLKNGQDIALISDAGTPCISDPGYTLVSRAAGENIRVVPIPGCSAVTAGLSVSGLPTDSFIFLGFLPRKTNKLQQALKAHLTAPGTLIIYESPNRILKTLAQAADVFGDRNACLAREVTKIHEEFIRGNLCQIIESLEKRDRVRGEIVLFIHGHREADAGKKLDEKALDTIIQDRMAASNLSTSDLAKSISREYPVRRKQVYDRILKLKSS